MASIRWKPNEIALVADRLVDLVDANPGWSHTRLLRQAQEMLTAEELALDRRRAIKGMSQTLWYPDELAAARTRRAAQVRREQQRAQQAQQAQEAAAAAATAEEEQAVNGFDALAHDGLLLDGDMLPAQAQPPATSVALGAALVSLRALLVDELAAIIGEAAVKMLGARGAADPAPKQPVAGNGARRASVLIAGLRGLQKEEVAKRYGRMLDLSFVGPDESKDQLRLMTEKADTVVVLTHNLSASQVDIVKARTKHMIVSEARMALDLYPQLSTLAAGKATRQ